MGYPQEIQNEYNMKYYEQNKNFISLKQSTKDVCKYCGRCVRHDNIWKHTKSAYCVNRRKLLRPSYTPPPAKILNKEQIAMKSINALMQNMERLYHENKLVESATIPFHRF